ncbi:MAG: c-type cytochrome [Acidobacteriaceae bacterium]|nr:c-type cytochrome [Acidobacteriaceae bacterium]
MRLCRVGVIACILLSAAFVFAQDPDSAEKLAASPEVAGGRAVFQQNCSFCHGIKARGASGPDLIHSSLVSHDVNGDLVGQVVRNGRPDKGMPAFQLTETQIRAIAAYLHSEAHLASTTYQRGPGDYPLEKLLVGNAASGKVFFKAKCAECHSPTGDLAHIATKYKPIDLQSRIAFPSGAVPTVTVTDSAGKVFTGSQVYADEFVISLRDKNNWIHTWNRNLVKIEIKDPLAAHENLLSTYTDENLHDLFAYLETLS